MPSAFCGVGMPSRRRLASERRKEGEEFNTSHFSGNGDRPLLGHQLDRPSTFGRPRTVAMVDRWRVSLIDPYPSRGGVMVPRRTFSMSAMKDLQEPNGNAPVTAIYRVAARE